MPPGLCRDNLLALTCSQFLPCFGGLVPQPVCRGLCDDVNTACSALFVLAGLNLLDCSAANPLVPSQPLYPTGSVSVPGVGEVPCIDYRSLAPPSPPAPPAEFSLSGTCQPYFGGAPCYGLVEGLVFVPDGTTQQDMIANNSALLGAVELAPSSCKQSGKAFFCRSLFMGCLENLTEVEYPSRHAATSATRRRRIVKSSSSRRVQTFRSVNRSSMVFPCFRRVQWAVLSLPTSPDICPQELVKNLMENLLNVHLTCAVARSLCLWA